MYVVQIQILFIHQKMIKWMSNKFLDICRYDKLLEHMRLDHMFLEIGLKSFKKCELFLAGVYNINRWNSLL